MAENTTAIKGAAFNEGPTCKMYPALCAAFSKLEVLLRDAPIEAKCRYLPDFTSNDEGVQDAASYDEAVTRFDYFTRYAYGYGYEYLCMWDDVLQDMTSQGGIWPSLNVLSIGCGSGIDFWSLRGALWQHRVMDRNRRLIGVDFADWSDCCIGFDDEGNKYRKNHRELGSRYRWNRDAAAYLESEEAVTDRALESNIVVFPKSLGELDDATVSRIARSLADMARERQLYLCICPAHATSDEVLWRDEPLVKHHIALLLRDVAGDENLAPIACGERSRSEEHLSERAPSDWNGYLSRDEERKVWRRRQDMKACCPYADEDPCHWLPEGETECPLCRAPINTNQYPCYRVYRIPKQG